MHAVDTANEELQQCGIGDGSNQAEESEKNTHLEPCTVTARMYVLLRSLRVAAWSANLGEGGACARL